MINVRLGYGCGLKVVLLTPAGSVCDLRKATYISAVLRLPSGETMPADDISVDKVTNAVYVRLLEGRELTKVGTYAIVFNVKLEDGVMYSTPSLDIVKVSEIAEEGYQEITTTRYIVVTDLPENAERTGASPKVSTRQTWLVYNDEAKAYEDTGIPAEVNLDDYYTKDETDKKVAELESEVSIIEKSKVVELKVISSVQAEYQNITEGEYSYNPALNQLNYTIDGLHYQTTILKDTIFKYADKLLLINSVGEMLLCDTLIPILEWSLDPTTLLSVGKGNCVYNKYSKRINIVTDSQLWVVNFNPNALFIYNGELFSWDAENSILTMAKDIAEISTKAEVGVLAKNTLDKIVLKSVGDEITNDELFDILINPKTGAETEYKGAYASGYIPIMGSEEYYVSGSMSWSNAVYAWYDENKAFISGYAAAGGSTVTKLVNELVLAPQNAAYIRVCRWTTNQEGKVNNVYLSAIGSSSSNWEGKKWVCVGDSLTEKNSRATMNYHDYVAEATGIEVVNMGVSGTGYKRQEESGNAFYQRVENIPTDADVITIFGSGNDGAYWGSNLGTASDTTTDTIGGCMNITIDNILARMPLAVIGIVSPCPWGDYPPSTDNAMKRYSALLKQICERRGIPFLDLYLNSGLRPWDATFRELAYSRDNGGSVHPDENGHKLIAPRFKAFLDSLIL